MEHSTARAAALAYFDAIAGADADSFAALFGPDVQFEDPVGGPVLQGQDGVRKFHKGLRRAWQALRMDVQDLFARGDRAAVRWHATGHSATGKDITFEGINVIAVDGDGKIARLEGYWDFEGVVGQM